MQKKQWLWHKNHKMFRPFLTGFTLNQHNEQKKHSNTKQLIIRLGAQNKILSAATKALLGYDTIGLKTDRDETSTITTINNNWMLMTINNGFWCDGDINGIYYIWYIITLW